MNIAVFAAALEMSGERCDDGLVDSPTTTSSIGFGRREDQIVAANRIAGMRGPRLGDRPRAGPESAAETASDRTARNLRQSPCALASAGGFTSGNLAERTLHQLPGER